MSEDIEAIDMFPAAKKPGFAEKFNKFNSDRHECDYQCYMVLCEILSTSAIEMAMDRLHTESGANRNMEDMLRKAEHWTSKRSKVNDKLLRLMAGQEVPDDDDRDIWRSVGREDSQDPEGREP